MVAKLKENNVFQVNSQANAKGIGKLSPHQNPNLILQRTNYIHRTTIKIPTRASRNSRRWRKFADSVLLSTSIPREAVVPSYWFYINDAQRKYDMSNIFILRRCSL